MAEFGSRGDRGNLVGIQPYMLPGDYASREHLYRKLSGYLEAVGEQGWLKHALARRLSSSGARHGIYAFLRGKLWDLSSDGRTIAVRDSEVMQARHVSGASLASLWL